LRLQIIDSGGELQSHGIRLIQPVLDQVPYDAELVLCYGVACLFDWAQNRYYPDWMEVVEAQIGRFHIYGHEYR
jgi:hypothetical protein